MISYLGKGLLNYQYSPHNLHTLCLAQVGRIEVKILGLKQEEHSFD